MPTYIVLGKFNSAEAIATYPQRRAGLEELARSLGGRLIGRYLTMGQYDVVVVFEAPNDIAAAQQAVRGAARVPGGVHTETLRAFDEEEAQEIARAFGTA